MRAIITAATVFGAIAMFQPSAALAQGDEAFCLQQAGKEAVECRYRTMAQCEEAAKGLSTATCIRNPRAARNN